MTQAGNPASRARSWVLALGAALALLLGLAAAAQASVIIYECGDNLCRVDPVSGASSPITRDGTADVPYRQPKLSRDGSRLAFLHGPRRSSSTGYSVDGVYVSDANGGGRIGPFRNQGADTTPPASLLAIKPDGSRVAYTHIYATYAYGGFTPEPHSDLESFASDGSDQQYIRGGVYAIGFAPDGYLANNSINSPVAICLLSAPSTPRANDATCARNVAADPGRDLFDPVVSPDGSRVAASSCASSGCSGGARIELFSYATGAPIGFSTAGPGDGTPAFSPTGDRIAFDRSATAGERAIYTMPAGGGPGSETKLASPGSNPTWGGGPDTAPTTPGAGGTGGRGGARKAKGCKDKRKKAKGKKKRKKAKARSAAKKKAKKKGCKPKKKGKKKKKGRARRR